MSRIFPNWSNIDALINQGKMKEALAIVKDLRPETQEEESRSF